MSAIIVGAGTYGHVFLSYLTTAGVEVRGFLDDNPELWGKEIYGLPVYGSTKLIGNTELSVASVYCPIGANKTRVEVLSRAEAAGIRTPNFFHAQAHVGPDVEHGSGVYILPGAVIMPHVIIEDYVMISASVNVAHHTRLKKGVFISSQGNVGASINVGEEAYLGMGCTLVTGKCTRVGAKAVVGAGAVVIADVEDKTTVAGVPATAIRK